MARHLTDRDVERIVEQLDGWHGKLTWDLLCDACKPIIGIKPARQTLYRFSRVRDAFAATNIRLRSSGDVPQPPASMKASSERIARLEAENDRLKRENNNLLEQFVRWQYNAYVRGLTDKDLNKPLPGIDLGNTE